MFPPWSSSWEGEEKGRGEEDLSYLSLSLAHGEFVSVCLPAAVVMYICVYPNVVLSILARAPWTS